MSIPGFSELAELAETQVTEVQIPARGEWRFEVPFRLIMKLRVKDGVGEIFGTELPNDVDVRLSGCKGAVYAPLRQCTITYETQPNRDNINISAEEARVAEYISDISPAPEYQRLHFGLEVMRQEAAAKANLLGPRVLILGPKQLGKLALARTLALYAAKVDRVPMLVNLDPKMGVFSVPGLLTATPISDFLDLESSGGYGGLTTSGALSHNPKQPIVKSYGFDTVGGNTELYKHQVQQLGVVTLSRAHEDPDLRAAGLIVDTPPLLMKEVAVVEGIVLDFEINVIVVTGNDRLTVDLKRKFAHKVARQALTIVRMPPNGAVAEVDDAFVRKTQEETIKEYFNGNHRTRLLPFKTDVDLTLFVIYKAVTLQEYESQMAFLPAGDLYTHEDGSDEARDKNTLDKFYVKLDEPSSSNLENSVLAITHLPAPAGVKLLPRDIMNASVMGYAHVSKVDDVKQKMSLLLPFPGQVPRHVLIATSIGYTE